MLINGRHGGNNAKSQVTDFEGIMEARNTPTFEDNPKDQHDFADTPGARPLALILHWIHRNPSTNADPETRPSQTWANVNPLVILESYGTLTTDK